MIEIEGLLFRHPAVQSVAIVGTPDARLGERACAFVVPKFGQRFSFDDMAHFMTEQKVARQYVPERLEVLDELPLQGAYPSAPRSSLMKFRGAVVLVRQSGRLFAIPHGTRFGEKAAAGRITGTCLSPYRRVCRGLARPRERPAIRQC